jgi:hypothetical protein
MPFSGGGIFTRIHSWVADRTAGIKIRADRMDAEFDNFASGLGQCVTRSGASSPTANLPMATFRHTNVGAGQSRTEYATVGQIQDNVNDALTVTGGTGNAIVATLTPALTGYAAGQMFSFTAAASNTGPVTIAINGLAAAPITKNGATALAAGDIVVGRAYVIRHDGVGFQVIGLSEGFATWDDPIINGQFEVAQRGTTFNSTSDPNCLDRWVYQRGTSICEHTISQNTDVPTVAQAGYALIYSLRLSLSVADATISGADYCAMAQAIEGHRWSRLWQRSFKVRFWVKATLPGTYSVALRSGGLDRSYVVEYTISASNTWEQKTLQFPASPSTGTWGSTADVGATILFTLAVGPAFAAAPGVWVTGNIIGSANHVNGVNSGATDFRLADVQILPDASSVSSTPRPFNEQLRLCQRYLFKTFGYGVSQAAAALGAAAPQGSVRVRLPHASPGTIAAYVPFPVPMRVAPTITFYNPQQANANWHNTTLGVSGGAASNPLPSEFGTTIEGALVAGDLAGHAVIVHFLANAELPV